MKYIFSIFLVFVSLFLFGQCDNLPTIFPFDPIEREEANSIIAKCFAPTINQMAERDDEHALDGISDLILAVNYDGDWNTTNNWENLEDFEDVANMSSIDALDPKVYYSVVWTDRAWVITYGFYHPRDWSLHTGLCCDNPTIGLPWIPETGDNHENDFEGVILFVSRISTSNGIEPFEVFGAASIAHSELKTYFISSLPEVFVDNRSHAVELNLEGLDCIDYDSAANCDNCKYFFATDHIVYSPVDQDQEPFVTSDDNNDDDYLSGFGNYELEDIFENSSESLWSQRDNTDVFVGDIFAREDGTDCTEYGGDASAPWGWSQFSYNNS